MIKSTRFLVLCAALLCSGSTAFVQDDSDFHRPSHESSIAPEKRVDINQASVEELLRVPGMKRTWAERIVRFRPYNSKQDLLDKGIVPNAVFDRIRDYVIAHRKKDRGLLVDGGLFSQSLSGMSSLHDA